MVDVCVVGVCVRLHLLRYAVCTPCVWVTSILVIGKGNHLRL